MTHIQSLQDSGLESQGPDLLQRKVLVLMGRLDSRTW